MYDNLKTWEADSVDEIWKVECMLETWRVYGANLIGLENMNNCMHTYSVFQINIDLIFYNDYYFFFLLYDINNVVWCDFNFVE